MQHEALFSVFERFAKRKVTMQGLMPANADKPKVVQNRFDIEGRLSAGRENLFSVDNQDFIIDDNTWILGDLKYGSNAKVKGSIDKIGRKYARTIIAERP